MDFVRTPDERFANLPGYSFAPHYAEVPDGQGGLLRMHYVDDGLRDAAESLLTLLEEDLEELPHLLVP